MMKTIMVTGGAGFIGSRFIEMLYKESPDVSVVCVDSMTYAADSKRLANVISAFASRYQFIVGDINNSKLIEQLCQVYSISGIINFAAETHVDRSIDNPTVFASTNIMGTLSLLNVARKCKVERFVQVSTDEVYGSLGTTGRFTEDTPLCPSSPYSAAKTAADLLVSSYFHTYGMNVGITRCSNNYGPWQYPEKLIPLMICNALKDQPLPVYGDGMNIRDWIHVDDHCRAVWRVFVKGQPGRVYNIGGDSEQTNIFIVKEILRILGKPETLISYVKDRAGHDRRYAMDSSRIRLELGWHPIYSFADYLPATVCWYKDNAEWMEEVVARSSEKKS
jgi:dTDP-glucose 4,6-dehydratase